MRPGAEIRRRVVDAAIRNAGWSIPTKVLEQARDFANYALGAGSATLTMEGSGEAALLRGLARAWDGREVVLFDVGAHRGNYAAAALEAFRSVRLECFEPDPENFGHLAARLGDRARLHPLALGERPGSATLYTNPQEGYLSSLHPAALADGAVEPVEVEVEVDTVDAVAARLGVDRIDLLKIDVEGHEVAVLRGARRLLDAGAITAVQFEFGERNIASRTFLRDFCDLLPDHALYRLTRRGLALTEYRPTREVFLSESNYVAIRHESRAAVASMLRR